MKRVIGLLIFMMSALVASISFAQSADDNLVKLADEMYGFGDKKDALAVYLQAVEVNPDNVLANYMAGKCYLETIDKELSVTYLIKAYQLKPAIAVDILFKIGMGYQLGGKFDEAIKYYNMYKEVLTDEKAKLIKSTLKDEVIKTERKLSECANGKQYYTNINHFKIENVKDVINSEYPDYVPSITADQSMMIFTSRRAGGVGKNKDVDNEYYEDVWVSKKDAAGEWTSPINIGPPINTTSHDANIGLSPDGKKIFIRKPENGGDIYQTEIMPDGKWAEPVPIGVNINSKYDEPSVAISNDGKTLFFSSNRPGGFGGFDIYKSEMDGAGKWGKPYNLGSVINTEYDEDSPFIDMDGKTLYFSSRGHKGMGGYDIYKAVYDDKKKAWSSPENMGYPVNSPDDDIYFVIAGDGKTGYYASAKGDGYGDKDIYKIYLKTEDDLSDLLKDDPTKKPVIKKDSINKPTPVATLKKDTIPTLAIKKDNLAPADKTTVDTKPIVKESIVPVVVDKTTVTNTVKPTEAKTKEPLITPFEKSNITDTKIVEPTVAKPKPPLLAKKEVVLYATTIKGNVYDQKNYDPLSAKLVLSDTKGNTVTEIEVGEDGNFATEVSAKVPTKYLITVNKEGYIYSNLSVVVQPDNKQRKVITKDIALKKTLVGQVFILRNIYFEFDKSIIKKESFPYLDKLAAWLKSNSNVHLEIGGHTDNLGLDQYNKILSQRRVNAVMLYLKAKGIAGERLIALGFGEEKPLASNDDETEGREINRRTEFRITQK